MYIRIWLSKWHILTGPIRSWSRWWPPTTRVSSCPKFFQTYLLKDSKMWMRMVKLEDHKNQNVNIVKDVMNTWGNICLIILDQLKFISMKSNLVPFWMQMGFWESCFQHHTRREIYVDPNPPIKVLHPLNSNGLIKMVD